MTRQRPITSEEYQKRRAAKWTKRGSGWSNATPATCRAGHRHPSKAETATCDRLSLECLATGATLHRQVRLPLFVLGLDKHGRASYMTVDFAIQPKGAPLPTRYVDTKGRIARGWKERAMAFRQTWGIEIEEVSR